MRPESFPTTEYRVVSYSCVGGFSVVSLARRLSSDIIRRLMPGVELIRSLLQQARVQGSRSTAINPLAWAFGIALSALLIALRIISTPPWILYLLGILAATVLLAFLAAYFFLLVKDRDALRSETFTLSKMAIERSVMGDNIVGFIDPATRLELPAVVVESKPKPHER